MTTKQTTDLIAELREYMGHDGMGDQGEGSAIVDTSLLERAVEKIQNLDTAVEWSKREFYVTGRRDSVFELLDPIVQQDLDGVSRATLEAKYEELKQDCLSLTAPN